MQVLDSIKKILVMTGGSKGAKTLDDVLATMALADEIYPDGIPGVDQTEIVEYCTALANDFGCGTLFDVYTINGELSIGAPTIKRVEENAEQKLMLCVGDRQFQVGLDWKKQKTVINGYETVIAASEKPSIIFKVAIDCPSIEAYYLEANCAIDYEAFTETYQKQNIVKPSEKELAAETNRIFALLAKGDQSAISLVRPFKKQTIWINPDDYGVNFFCGSYPLKNVLSQKMQTKDGKRTFPVYVALIELPDGSVAKIKPALGSPVAAALKQILNLGVAQHVYLNAMQIELNVTDFYTNENGYPDFKGALTDKCSRKKKEKTTIDAPPQKQIAVLSAAESKKLWNLAKKAGWDADSAKQYLLSIGVDSFNSIPIEQHEKLQKVFGSTEALNTTTSDSEMPWSTEESAA